MGGKFIERDVSKEKSQDNIGVQGVSGNEKTLNVSLLVHCANVIVGCM